MASPERSPIGFESEEQGKERSIKKFPLPAVAPEPSHTHLPVASLEPLDSLNE